MSELSSLIVCPPSFFSSSLFAKLMGGGKIPLSSASSALDIRASLRQGGKSDGL